MPKDKNRLKFKAMKCITCEAPVYYNAAQNGFSCLYRKNVMPYKGDDGVEETSDRIPVTVELPSPQSTGIYFLRYPSTASIHCFEMALSFCRPCPE
ncbi:hypothetical protein [Bacteroides heparinolyticus]|uniref:hypothetical protein n=1 Tax=Prevotella heparinolytica TaxID=28113 RepID=UPI0035A0D281